MYSIGESIDIFGRKKRKKERERMKNRDTESIKDRASREKIVLRLTSIALYLYPIEYIYR